MVSTELGDELIGTLIANNIIEAEARPAEEAYDYEKMLRSPSIPHRETETFRSEYRRTKDFDKAARSALKKDIRKNMTRSYLHVNDIKRVASRCCPKFAKIFIKKLLRK